MAPLEQIAVQVFGEGEQLSPLQMGCRAFVTFFAALVLIRFAGMRSFGKKSAFDIANGIMLGAVLSRGIVGASPWGATLVAGLVLVALDRLLALVGLRSRKVDRILKRESLVVHREEEEGECGCCGEYNQSLLCTLASEHRDQH